MHAGLQSRSCVSAAWAGRCTTSADGSEQTVEILYRDALSVLQDWLLRSEYSASDLQFEPELAASPSKQLFADYRHSLPNAVASAYLPRGQRTITVATSSDGSQYSALGRDGFHPVYIEPTFVKTERRNKADTKCVVALIPHVDGAEEKSRVYQEAITKAFASFNQRRSPWPLGPPPAPVAELSSPCRNLRAFCGRRPFSKDAR